MLFGVWGQFWSVQTVNPSTKAAVLNSQSVVAEAVGTTLDKCGDQVKMFQTNSIKQPQCIGPLLALAKQHGQRDAESHKIKIYHLSFVSFLFLTITKRQISPLFTFITISRCYWHSISFVYQAESLYGAIGSLERFEHIFVSILFLACSVSKNFEGVVLMFTASPQHFSVSE